jgi:predicted PurR-regulated permease PerM
VVLSSYIIAGVALVAALELGLLTVLLAGLAVWEIGDLAVPTLKRIGIAHQTGRAVAAALIAIIVSMLIVIALLALVPLLSNHTESFAALFSKMADVVASLKVHLPEWAANYIPASGEDLQAAAAKLLRDHATYAQSIGQDVGKFMAHVVIGMIIGGLVLAGGVGKSAELRPLSGALLNRVKVFALAFRRVVFAQVRISALNTILTAIYLAGVLPLIGIHLPLVKTMIVLTFLVGLIPVAGNLVSNTVVVIVSLSVSPLAAILSLGFLVGIHKLEYFINAKIVGSQINAKAWEILIAMVVMETAFGIPGIVAAPIYYAYLKDELTMRHLV